ncbi:MAG: Na+/Ca+ antiporter, CaCA family [Candidatus Peregrinibacteria bacterium GW2011_GWA2_54_9]|nr:MAG: Na+/Ca+ antiporter, CaCA family [Candidatus Peregrinibacteria bacterium GW2011_GWA2_54_9]
MLPAMPIIFTLILFAIGVLLLLKGANWLVEGASSLAHRLRISDLAIGLTVVAFGTSTPELIVNIVASIRGNADIAIGNVVGSNIANILLILGITAIIAPIAVQKSTILKEIPLSLLAGIVLYFMANDALIDGYQLSELGRGDGLVFLCFFLIFLYYTFGIRHGEQEEGITKTVMSLWQAVLLVVMGLAGLVVGGHFCVETAQDIALALGVSEALIGLILGVSALIKPLPFQPDLNIDLLMVVFASALLFFIVHNGKLHHRLFFWWKQEKDYIIKRWEGGVLLACYIAYVAVIAWRG